MSLWQKVKDIYEKIDQKVGGYLPGGVAPGSSSGGTSSGGTSSGSTSSGSTSSSSGSSSTSSSTSSSSSSTKSSGGGGGSIVSKLSSAYQSIDTKLGGYLPGGQTPAQVQAQKQAEQGKTLTSQQSTSSSNLMNTLTGGKTSSGSSSFLFGGGSSSSTNQSVAPSQQTSSSSSTNQSVAPSQQTSSSSSPLADKIKALESTPLGKPVVQDDRGTIRKGFDKAVDFVSGQTGGVWLTHFGRPTGMESSEIKEEFNKSTTKGVKDSILFGVPGVAGLTAEGKFKTAWSKDKDKKIDAGAGLGIGGIGNIQAEWTKSAETIGQSGKLTTLEQQAQAKSIEDISREIEKVTTEYQGGLTGTDMTDIAFGKKTYDDVLKEKAKSPGVQTNIFQKEADIYQKEVESFNKMYGEKELAPDVYEKALQEKSKLDAKRESLLAKQTSLTKAYEDYETGIVSKVAGLRDIGVETKIDEQGNIVFGSKALQKQVAPVGMKLQKDFMKDDKLTWKNIAYGGGSVVHTTAGAVAVGFATGGTGVLAKVGVGVAKLPKVAQVVIKGGAITLAVGGVASKGYSGYKLAQQVDVPGWYGATLGTATGIGQVGGFAVGGYYGTKAYYSGVQDKILAGKYTKSIGEMREGKIQVDLKSGTAKGGLAKQVGIYETKVKGTEWTIKSGVKMQGLYGKESGMSNVKIASQFQGKAPRGMPKGWTTRGQTLESQDAIRLRAFTKSTKGKVWYEQDFLMKRTMLERLKVDVSQKPAFKGYSELERLKFLTGMKSVGKPVKVGKVLPEQVWKSEELFRFAQYKGQGKVMQPWEFGEAKADSIFGTKQYVLYKHTKPQSATFKTKGGDLKISSTELGIKEFQSISKTSGMSAELLKQQLKDTMLVVKASQVNMMSDKSGQLTIMRPKPSVRPTTIQKTYAPQVTKPTTTINTQALLKIQLSKVVPGLIQKQVSGLKTSTLLFGAGISGTKQILQTRQSLAVVNEQALLQRTRQVSLQKMLQQQVPSQAQSIRQAQAVQTLQLQTPIMQAPGILTPIIPGFPGVPIMFDKPDLWGWKYKQPKESLAGKKTSSYIPDFTSKALGLKPKVMSKAQLKKLLRTDLTGLELRRGVIPA
jgi:hypothetical protein